MRAGKSHGYEKRDRKKHVRSSSLKSVGKLMKARNMSINPMTAMQQMHLLHQEKGFLKKQIIIFTNKIDSIKQKLKEIDEKITSNRKFTEQMQLDIKDTEKDTNSNDVKTNKHTKPAKKYKRSIDDSSTMTLNY
jgi:GTP1/Obg family GTP-binding protein